MKVTHVHLQIYESRLDIDVIIDTITSNDKQLKVRCDIPYQFYANNFYLKCNYLHCVFYLGLE